VRIASIWQRSAAKAAKPLTAADARLAVTTRAAEIKVAAAKVEAEVEAEVETRVAVRAVPSAVLPLWILMSSARSLERAAKPLTAADARLAVAARAAVAAKVAVETRAAETAAEATAVGTRAKVEGKHLPIVGLTTQRPYVSEMPVGSVI